jgi:DNA-binding NarL/FixJ family response regulator
MKKIRTLLVDDSPEFLGAVSRFLEIDPLIEIVGLVMRGLEALSAIQEHQPDILLLDLAIPDINGMEIMRQIKEQIEKPPYIIILTLYDNPEYRLQSESLGADGFIFKSDLGDELLPTIHKIMEQGSSEAI